MDEKDSIDIRIGDKRITAEFVYWFGEGLLPQYQHEEYDTLNIEITNVRVNVDTWLKITVIQYKKVIN